jgi:phosphatidylglycerophosphate synthase
MIEKYLRSYYQTCCINPLLKYFMQVSPHTISLCACLIGILLIPALIKHFSLLAFFLLLLSGYLDSLDGELARIKNIQSPFGGALDIVGDRIVEFSVVLGLYGYAPQLRGWLTLLMLGSILICVTSFLVVGIFVLNDSQKSFYYSPGIIERPEAFIFFVLLILLPSWFTQLAIIFITLVLLTSLIRMIQFYRFNLNYIGNKADY